MACAVHQETITVYKDQVKIFVVDDSAFCRLIMKEFLLHKGYRNIHLFESGSGCLENMHLLPNIILIDYDMNRMNGIEVVQHLGAARLDFNCYVVMVSGQQDPRIRKKAIDEGAYAFVPKDEENFLLLENRLDELMQLMLN